MNVDPVLSNSNNIFSRNWLRINVTFALMLSLLADFFVPEQFLRDSKYYDQLISSSVTGYTGPINLIENTYSFIGVNTSGLFLRIFSTIIFIFNIYLISRFMQLKFSKIPQYMIVSASFLLIPFYGSGYSKELIVVIANIIIILILNKYKYFEYLYIPILSTSIGLTLRPYYLLTLLFFIIIYQIFKYFRSLLTRILILHLLFSTLITLEYKFKIVLTSTGYDLLNIRLNAQSVLGIAARSNIEHSAYNGNFFHNMTSFTQITESMIFPYNEFTLSPYIIFASGINTMVWVILLKCLTVQFSKTKNMTYHIAIFLLSFTLTAEIFEVDAGSFVRHFFPYLAFGAIIIGLDRNRHLLLKNSNTILRNSNRRINN
jgi:hypothetical protein